MRKTMKKLRNKKGITLIALVVTIVVLLILAGTTIAMLTGDNGIIARAAKAKEETDKAASEEEAGLQRTLQEIASRVPSVEGYNDIKEGDIIEVFVMEEVKRTKKSKAKQVELEHGSTQE